MSALKSDANQLGLTHGRGEAAGLNRYFEIKADRAKEWVKKLHREMSGFIEQLANADRGLAELWAEKRDACAFDFVTNESIRVQLRIIRGLRKKVEVWKGKAEREASLAEAARGRESA